MKTILRLECINDNWGIPPEILAIVPLINRGKGLPNRYWVAEITGLCGRYGYERRFLPYKKDYSRANSVGTRGVYAYYILDEGPVYEVSSPVSWRNTDRYFCRVIDGKIVRLAEQEVQVWARGFSESASTMRPGSA